MQIAQDIFLEQCDVPTKLTHSIKTASGVIEADLPVLIQTYIYSFAPLVQQSSFSKFRMSTQKLFIYGIQYGSTIWIINILFSLN